MRSIHIFVEILRTKGPPFQILLIYNYFYIDVATLPPPKSGDGRVARPKRQSPSLTGLRLPHR